MKIYNNIIDFITIVIPCKGVSIGSYVQ